MDIKNEGELNMQKPTLVIMAAGMGSRYGGLKPFVVDELIKEEKMDVKVLKTSDKWYGVTYKQDKEKVVNAIRQMLNQGKYPERLWNHE